MATIMVMDDEAPIRTLIRTALESVGHEVMEAANGHDGLALYRQRPADLVIADILMPELDGLDTIIELMQEFLDVKVIAISGAPEDQRMLNTARRCAIRIGTLAPPSLGSVHDPTPDHASRTSPIFLIGGIIAFLGLIARTTTAAYHQFTHHQRGDSIQICTNLSLRLRRRWPMLVASIVCTEE